VTNRISAVQHLRRLEEDPIPTWFGLPQLLFLIMTLATAFPKA
jgi:hypothetical protein